MVLVGYLGFLADPLGPPTLPLLVIITFIMRRIFGAAWDRPYPPYSLQCGQLVGFIPYLLGFLLLLLLGRDLLRCLGGGLLGDVEGVRLQCRCRRPFLSFLLPLIRYLVSAELLMLVAAIVLSLLHSVNA